MNKAVGFTSSLLCTLFAASLLSSTAHAQAHDAQIRTWVEQAKNATRFYANGVEAAFKRHHESTPKHCKETREYEPEQECLARIQQEYLAEWQISEAPLKKPVPLTRVIVEAYTCKGDGVEHYSYLQYSPENSVAKKRINALLEPLIVSEPDEFTDEGECMANEIFEYQNVFFGNSVYLNIVHQGSTYYYRAAHPMPYGRSQHLNVTTGEVIPSAFIFNETPMKPLITQCVAKLAEEVGMDMPNYLSSYGEDVAGSFNNAEYWSFSPDVARIEFPPYHAGSYADGFLECEFPLTALKPYLQESFVEDLLAN